ncbi:MAG: hypothetical protein U1B77_04095, partial [Dehalococcoidales bacterium]|nr:hypothetical protein [Dehalococcoidales bacterium]
MCLTMVCHCYENDAHKNTKGFVIPAPYQVRGKLQRESSRILFWILAFARMTVLDIFSSVVLLVLQHVGFLHYVRNDGTLRLE